MSLRIKKSDKVIVLAGKEKGKSGKVLKVLTSKQRVIVEGINLVKKHVKRKSEAEVGGIKEIPASLNISNVALFCGNCSKGVRFSIKLSKDKSKTRVCKKCNRAI